MNNKDRILIDGVWYIRETALVEQIDVDITEFRGGVYETHKYCWGATQLKLNDGEYEKEILEQINSLSVI